MRDLWSDIHVCEVQLMLRLLLTSTCRYHCWHRLHQGVIHHLKRFLVEHLRLQVIEISLVTSVVCLRVSLVFVLTIGDLYLYLLVLFSVLKLIVLNDFLLHRLMLIIALISIRSYHPVSSFRRLVLVALLGAVVLLIEVLVG